MGTKAKLKINNSAIKLLIIIGTVTWSLVMIKSGLIYSFGKGFWGPNGHDGVWHIALINHLANGNWQMPVFAGETLRNYHVGYDLLLAILHRITTIPAETLYFQIIPPIIAFLTGFLTYKFVYLWKKSKIQAFWATFFIYFAGSFGWVISLAREGQIGGESLFWSQQAISTLINPPFALSVVLILLGLIGLLKLKKSSTIWCLLAISLIFGILAQIKVYAGILSLGGLFIAGLYEFIKRKKTTLIKVFVISSIFAALFFFPLNQNAVGLIVFRPFWFLETMMGLSDRFYWPRFAEAMVNYRLGNIWYKAIPAYFIAFLIFVVGNMGIRIIKAPLMVQWFRKYKKLSFIEIFFAVVIFFGIIFPMFFLQKGTPWNTIQFFYYSLTFSGIFAGVVFGEWLERKGQRSINILGIIIIILSIPTTVATLKHYLPSRPPAKISNEELEALSFLSKQSDGIVLTYPFDREAAKQALANPPRPLYLYESTAYVSAFSEKIVYLEDEVNLDITGYDWRGRREKVELFLKIPNQEEARSFLEENNISYIYWIIGQRAILGESQLGITKIFENSEVDIFAVNN
ncbi:hypothetical protein KKE18_04190 [Patescibacteria group bacterium]|nr:hypothetical protein [Patescibacteria group bacterium]MBU0777339.1 hypothetical protein [Patescibacteria group bacterium]MBU0922515.1 hypothetical protein [Patescibacteria group bacterium]MBU1844856.1 hypothetical protein [Patescibacteria group bacterium]